MTDVLAIKDPNIEPVSIEEEMQRSYLDYSMSVIVSRALPDVRDGMKPVHRRILYAMKVGKCTSNDSHKKSARVVGDVMGKYHPHGDSAIYDSMVRMAQDFSLRVPLISGQGNFGSIDGDNPAAMRYTEVRFAKISETLLDDIDKDTVDFVPNYDETLKEPSVLPARFPNILVNGGSGIAVGMATNIPPHNLGEIIDACVAYIENPAIEAQALYAIVPGPDFPTGGIIIGEKGRQSACMTGRGSILIRSKTHMETNGNREAIVVTEIPYQVNKTRLILRIADAVREGNIGGIADLRDESDREGIRIVVEVKRDAIAEVVLSNLFKYTPLQTSFGVNTLAIKNGKPELLNLRDVIATFVEFREEVILRRTTFDLERVRDKAHIFVGLLIAITNIDPVLNLIRSAKTTNIAKEQLMKTSWNAEDVEQFITLIDDPDHRVIDGKYTLSEKQARAILELRLQRLTGMERQQLKEDMLVLEKKIEELLKILSSRRVRMELMKKELLEIRDQFATKRKTELVNSEFEYDMEELIQREDMVVTVTHSGYIKRVPLSTYRAQRRGGKGRSGMQTKEDDFLVKVFVENTHTSLLMFSSLGMCYTIKVYCLPLGTPQSRGKALLNLLPLQKGETITAMMPFPQDEAVWDTLYLMFVTCQGSVRRNRLSDFTNIRTNGKIAMKLAPTDRLINVLPCTQEDDVLLASKKGMAVRFPVTDVRIFSGRNSVGVRGIRLKEKDSVISMTIVKHFDAAAEERAEYIAAVRAETRTRKSHTTEDRKKAERLQEPKFKEMQEKESFILTVSTNGYGQLASSYDYRITKRGGKGIANMEMRNKKSSVAGSFRIVPDKDEIILVTEEGQIIRIPTNTIRFTARNTKGVRLFNVRDNSQKVISVAHLHDLDNTQDIQKDQERQ